MKINKDNLIKFFDRKGFYIVLFLCIVVVAVTAVYVTNNNLKKMSEGIQQGEINSKDNTDSKNLVTEYPSSNQQRKENSQDTVTTNGGDKNVLNNKAEGSEANENNAVKSDNNISKNTAQDSAPQNTTTTANVSFTLLKPVNGDVIMAFAKDKLVYSKTLDEWTTHKGVDLKAPIGTAVLAAMEGTVAKVYYDAKLGNTVVIKNGSYETRYANLDDGILVKTGEKVKKGQEIGKIGSSAKFEIAEDPHLHFELIKDGIYLDPMQYFR
ncbi:M23 family metallopeptidase [Aceticella autotrophica]|uniref:M23 family metallopeptidase n=1 Tax=Aceticella autotrophica TaxID=2755338 RepID=A0A975AWH0_9THEO|nr:M23 family metallopeptidase [Aceticella autotrophica]QSZ27693.1 M23 family metallopeptidase [Aceticella autotrophica]